MGKLFNSSVLFSVLFFITIGCKKKEEKLQNVQQSKINAQLVLYIKAISSGKEINVKDALIKIYTNEEDRDRGSIPYQQKTTDSTGSVKFSNIEKEECFLKIMHINYGELSRNVSTPDKSTAYNTFVFQ
jgi:hypothetical protein